MKNSSSKYSSHRPVLSFLPTVFTISKIAEFGCGVYSTCIFLDKSIYPHASQVVSLESDQKWAIKNPKDERLIVVCQPEKQLLTEIAGRGVFDLVFVDGKSKEMRVPSVIASKKYSKMVVLHDAEHYPSAFDEFKFVCIFTGLRPFTSIMSDYDIFQVLPSNKSWIRLPTTVSLRKKVIMELKLSKKGSELIR